MDSCHWGCCRLVDLEKALSVGAYVQKRLGGGGGDPCRVRLARASRASQFILSLRALAS